MSAVRAGRASVTPLMLDLTDRQLLDRVRTWQLADFARHEGPARRCCRPRQATGSKLRTDHAGGSGMRWTPVRAHRGSRVCWLLAAASPPAATARPLHQPPRGQLLRRARGRHAWPTSRAAERARWRIWPRSTAWPRRCPAAGGAGGVRAARRRGWSRPRRRTSCRPACSTTARDRPPATPPPDGRLLAWPLRDVRISSAYGRRWGRAARGHRSGRAQRARRCCAARGRHGAVRQRAS